MRLELMMRNLVMMMSHLTITNKVVIMTRMEIVGFYAFESNETGNLLMPSSMHYISNPYLLKFWFGRINRPNYHYRCQLKSVTDWTPGITDTPGGCATETGAYRRVVLTWARRNGPFNYRELNAHRVRITDSFTHYHPEVGGFDEFYLVQMVQPGAKLLVSRHTDAIVAEDLGGLSPDEVFEEIELQVGDLVYLPRGTVHRGLGGVLAHVITVPGFIPGAEIGVDHHLAAINEANGWDGAAALPLHAAGARRPIRR